MEDKRFAVLIDSDNISAKYIARILDEMTKYGVITYKRIYGDWTSSHTNKWKPELLENSIIPIQQFSNTTGKNATDSALIIDAMDILYTDNVDGFCIVSSDSDFTRLASRLRESGMDVIGMGEDKTPRSFRAACTVFTSLEVLVDREEEKEEPVKNNAAKRTSNQISKSTIEMDIVDIITENEDKGKTTGLGEIGSRLVKKYPDFDVRSYGYSLLSKFLEEMQELVVQKINNTITVSLADNHDANEEILSFIQTVVKNSKMQGLVLGDLANIIKARYTKFNVKDYGYSQFLKFINSIDHLVVSEDKEKQKIVHWENN